jgi:hypothetical protein
MHLHSHVRHSHSHSHSLTDTCVYTYTHSLTLTLVCMYTLVQAGGLDEEWAEFVNASAENEPSKWNVMLRMQQWMIGYLDKYGFWAILAFASWYTHTHTLTYTLTHTHSICFHM